MMYYVGWIGIVVDKKSIDNEVAQERRKKNQGGCEQISIKSFCN